MLLDPAEEQAAAWWLSFCDTDKPEGQQFLGAAIVEAPTLAAATIKAHALGCNPGGQVAGRAIDAETLAEMAPPETRGRLLSKADLAELGWL